MAENATDKLIELRRTVDALQRDLDEQERTYFERYGFVHTTQIEIRRSLKRVQAELVYLELEQDLKAIEARFVKFERAQDTPPSSTDAAPLPSHITADTVAHLVDRPIVPILKFDVDSCVDEELSIIPYPLKSHTQASSLVYTSLDFTKLDQIKDTNVLASVQDILIGVKAKDLDKIHELKTNGPIVVKDDDVKLRIEWLIAWSFKANERRVHQEKGMYWCRETTMTGQEKEKMEKRNKDGAKAQEACNKGLQE